MTSRTAEEWEQFLGEQVRTLRLRKNMSQKELAERAQLSLSTLANLESGKGTTLKSFTAVLSVLQKESWLEALAPQIAVSPLQIAELGKVRQRASRTSAEGR
ncbi:MAG: helix-turn-helix domain-containing protein [Coriobacteriia bacterium]|nr:helix-turn-helix domain-containing protein [Coriobacteriia bacterium]